MGYDENLSGTLMEVFPDLTYTTELYLHDENFGDG